MLILQNISCNKNGTKFPPYFSSLPWFQFVCWSLRCFLYCLRSVIGVESVEGWSVIFPSPVGRVEASWLLKSWGGCLRMTCLCSSAAHRCRASLTDLWKLRYFLLLWFLSWFYFYFFRLSVVTNLQVTPRHSGSCEVGSLRNLWSLDFGVKYTFRMFKTNLMCVKQVHMQAVIKYLIYQLYVVVLACTMLRILIHLWGLCIFLYCYNY